MTYVDLKVSRFKTQKVEFDTLNLPILYILIFFEIQTHSFLRNLSQLESIIETRVLTTF